MIDEKRFRAICRKDQGGIEGAKFEEALNASKDDPVSIRFEVGLDEFKAVELPRSDVVLYAKIAKEERAPEDELLQYIKPEAKGFVRHNRTKIIGKLKEIMVQYPMYRMIVLTWPLWTPDTVPFSVAEAYVRKYE